MREPFGCTRHVGVGRMHRQRAFRVAQYQVAAHTGGQVDNHIGSATADALDHLGIERRIAAAFAGCRVAHMDMRDGRTGLSSLDSSIRNLFRRDRKLVRSRGTVACAGDRAGDKNLKVHVPA